jgi:mRNA interferase MazF
VKRGDFITVALKGDYGKPRPALVIQSDRAANTASIAVLLLTSNLVEASYLRVTVEPDQTNGLRATSQVQIDRPMSFPRDKAGPVIGRLDNDALAVVTRNLALFLGIA